jgi:hypothetical protein
LAARPASFAIKADVPDIDAERFTFPAQKTMYGGRTIAAGDRIYLFASENEGGAGLFARGRVVDSEDTPRSAAPRRTPRVSIEVRRDGTAKQPLGRTELRGFRDWADGKPETELNFKLYRQATNKIVGLTDEASAFLDGLF